MKGVIEVTVRKRMKSSFEKNRRIKSNLSTLRIGHSNVTHSCLMEGGTNAPM